MSCSMGDLFFYDTVKIVKIKSKVLGIIHWTFMLAIITYLAVFVFGLNKKYLLVETPVGTARISIHDPCNVKNESQYCTAGGNESQGIAGECYDYENFRCTRAEYCATNETQTYGGGYGEKLSCRYWDHNSQSWPNAEHMAVTVGSRVELYHQYLQDQQGDLCYDQQEIDCQWYPPIGDHRNGSYDTHLDNSYYLGDVGNFTLKLYHQAHGTQVDTNIIGSDTEGWLMRCKDGKVCDPNGDSDMFEKYKHLPANGKGDILRVQDLLDCAAPPVENSNGTAGLNLDDTSDACPTKCNDYNSTFRYVGVMLTMTVFYDNTGLVISDSDNSWGIGTGTPKYQVRVTTQPAAKFNVQVTQNGGGNANRSVHHIYGPRFLLSQTGTLADFDFNALLLQMTASVALIAVATVIVDILLEYFMPDRNEYTKHKYETTEEIEDSGFTALLDNVTEIIPGVSSNEPTFGVDGDEDSGSRGGAGAGQGFSENTPLINRGTNNNASQRTASNNHRRRYS